MAHSVLSVDGLSFSYGDKRIFDNLSLSFEEGVVTTLIGANGSGKSTLFNLMTKNLSPAAGSVRLRGVDVADLRLRDFARLVAIVHQRNIVPGDLSVERLVRYGREPYQRCGIPLDADADDRMVAWALEVTGLSDLARQRATSLSGGQAQRAWIAMALAQGTDVLLLDEPTTYLDIRYQLDILRLVRRLNSEFGLTVIMVLHDINQALAYSDQVVALAQGEVVAAGEPAQVVTPKLLRRVYDVDLRVIEVASRPVVVDSWGAGDAGGAREAAPAI